MRTALYTAAALACFVSNSLLTRGALGLGLLDAPAFIIVRLATGAAALALLLGARQAPTRERGSWTGALALAGYAVAFTIAYTRIDAGVGALLLFGAVQITMIVTGVLGGERPTAQDWLGLALATIGLLWLSLPGASAPDPLGSALMVLAGVSWGAYSLVGRGSRDPLAGTAGNFWRAAVLGALTLVPFLSWPALSWPGLALAAVSGAIASGVGYTFWYTALPALTAWRAALIQLPVPVLTALAAVALLGEVLTARLLVATSLVCGGVALSLAGRRRQSRLLPGPRPDLS